MVCYSQNAYLTLYCIRLMIPNLGIANYKQKCDTRYKITGTVYFYEFVMLMLSMLNVHFV